MTKTARLYGDSLYDLALEEGLDTKMLEEVEAVREFFRENPEYLKLLQEPSIAKEERIGLIDQAFKGQVEPYLVNFVKLLCERGLLIEYAGCAEEYLRRYDQDHGIVSAVVTSVLPLTKEQESALHAKLEQISKKTVRLTARTDPSLIGGLRVELDGKLMDGTVKERLSGISRRISEI